MDGLQQNTHIKSIKRRKYENADNIYKNILVIRTLNTWQDRYLEKITEKKKIIKVK